MFLQGLSCVIVVAIALLAFLASMVTLLVMQPSVL